MKTISSWQWSAFGKHPVAKDFFRLGQDHPLLKGFSDWVEKGYQVFISKNPTLQNLHAWRFWARGTQKESVACGVVRDSSDQVGRPYPLLIIGTGMLNGWEEHWHLMPFACERTWDQIEYLSAFVANDLKKFEQEVQHIRPPLAGWSDFEMNRKDLKELKEQISLSSDHAEFVIDLKGSSNDDPLIQASSYLSLIQNRIKTAPNAVFMGGTLDRICLAFFRRPLQTSDFVQLWTDSMKG